MRRPQSGAGEVNQENIEFPTPNTPVVWAGCRINLDRSTPFAYGGYGTYFSKGSLQRLMQPLHCDETAAEFEQEKCVGLEPKTNNNASIGEKEFFQSGDSINQMMYKYVRNVETFCLHSDWFIAYIVNFYNISRHVVTNGMELDKGRNSAPEVRLHALMGSEILQSAKTGSCLNDSTCPANATICHYVNETGMQMAHFGAQKLLISKN